MLKAWLRLLWFTTLGQLTCNSLYAQAQAQADHKDLGCFPITLQHSTSAMVHTTGGGDKTKQSTKPNTFEQHHAPSTLMHQCTNCTHPPNKAPTSDKALTARIKEPGMAYQETHRKRLSNMQSSVLPPRTRPQTALHRNLHANEQQQSDIEQHGSLKLHSPSNTASRLPQASQTQPHGSTANSGFTTTDPRLYSVITPPCSGPAPGKSLLLGPDIIHPVHPSNHIKKQHHFKEEHHLESCGEELTQGTCLLQPKMDNQHDALQGRPAKCQACCPGPIRCPAWYRAWRTATATDPDRRPA